MRLVIFKKDFDIFVGNDKKKVRRGKPYIFSELIFHHLMRGLSLHGIDPKIILKEVSDIRQSLQLFDIDSCKGRDVIMIRTGGVGDLIALSGLVKFLRDQCDVGLIKFVSQEKYRSVFEWFEEPINFAPYFSPVAKTPSKLRNFRVIFFEGVIEASKKNWFMLQHDVIRNKEYPFEYFRPFLRSTLGDRVKNLSSLGSIDFKFKVLINPRSTSIVRSMKLEDIYIPLKEVLTERGIDPVFFVHRRNLVASDLSYLRETKPNDVHIINAPSLEGFLADCHQADLAVSVDTAMIHFREGVRKPGIGIYGPFPKEARTEYYKETYTFNVPSECEFSPCFIHTKSVSQVCPKLKELWDKGAVGKDDLAFAPCLNKIYNQSLHETLKEEFKRALDFYGI